MLVSKHAALTANFWLNTFRDTPPFLFILLNHAKGFFVVLVLPFERGCYSDDKSLIIFDLVRVAFF